MKSKDYSNITTMEQLCEARKELCEQLQDADKRVAEHWEKLLNLTEPAHIAARVAKSVFDIVSQAAMVERIYKYIRSLMQALFFNDKSDTEGKKQF